MTSAIHKGLSPVRTVLENGAVVIAKKTEATPAVTIHAACAAGSVYDRPSLPGLAHFVSRAIDRGTVVRPADVIAEELDSRGVSLGVTVNRHVLSLVCTCLVDDLQPILDLLAEMVVQPAFPEEEIPTKRREIETMIRQDDDNPSAVATEALMADLYGRDHGYGRRLRGSIEAIARVDRESLQRFHESRFRPAALSLAMVGDVDPRRAVEAAASAFGRWQAPVPAPVELAAPQPSDTRRTRVVPMMNKAQTDIAYGFASIRRSDPEYYAFWLMNNILGQYALGGRLGDSIRERQGMAYYAFSYLDANVIPGPFFIRAGVSPANVERAIASIDAELARFAAEGPSDSELQQSKQYLVWSMPRALETNAGIANFLQTAEFFGLGLDYDQQLPGLLHAVTREQVVGAARQLLVPARASIVVAGPFDGELH